MVRLCQSLRTLFNPSVKATLATCMLVSSAKSFWYSRAFGTFFSDIIRYLEDNYLHTNVKHQNSVIAEAENCLHFNTSLFHFTVKSSKTMEHKMALCIQLKLSNGIFEL